MADPDVDELAGIQQSHHRRLLALETTVGDLVGDAWDEFGGLTDVASAEFTGAAAAIVDAGKRQTSTLAVGYMAANDRIGGFPDAGLIPVDPLIRGGASPIDVYHRAVVTARRRISEGAAFPDAMAAGRSRAVSTGRTDIALANRAEMDRGGALRPWVVGYRRVLTGRSCAFCATASTQRYRSAGLLPLHPGCDCDVGEIFGTVDPGRIINRDLLKQLQEAGRIEGRRDYWDGNYVVEGDGSIHFRKVETVRGPDGQPLRTASGQPVRQVVPGKKVKPDVVDHGDLGPTLSTSNASNVRPLPAKPEPRSKPTDTDVLAEARRRNVSPDRVVELREEKAERRRSEDRARRAAEKALAPDHPDVVDVARRYGVHPDDVISARARVADVRKVAREEAAKVQTEALRELDRFDALKLRNPPRTGSTTGLGASARRGEWDWLEQVGPRERARLSRQWYGGSQAPDQIAANMSAALDRDLSVDDAMEIWMRHNRTSEAAGALRRGKLPSLDAYSGQIDPARLIGSLGDDGYDAIQLFGDDLAAAGHIARVEADLVQREALDYLGDAVGAIEGPSPYRMSYQTWEAEVRDLERDVAEGLASAAERRRLGELVPQYLDEAGLDFEDLYARIISTARKAGEEVPDYARIPWA